MADDIKGKVILITGGASGMGRETALEFARLGAKVAVATARNITGGEETVRMIHELGGEAIFVQCDVTVEEQVKNMVERTVAGLGGLDFAFNNAGIGADGVRIPFVPLTEVTEQDWNTVMDTNLKGVFLCLKYELRYMQQHGGGAIVNNASIGGLKMVPHFGAYGPSKSGVIAITRAAALENARNGIRVNVVCPGPTVGTILMENSMRSGSSAGAEKELVDTIIPMGKMGTPSDVAKAVVFLCSSQSGHTTGQALSVDGGMAIT